MYDTAQNDQFPAGAQAYAAYVDGGIGDQPNYAYIVSTFPNAYHLSIALYGSNDADALDVEPGAASPSDVPGWYSRQKQRGIARPCVYASASTMTSSILPVLTQNQIPRDQVRLWSAHYGAGEHICGPNSCGLVPIDVDGTQWNNNALGLNLDQSLLLDTFFSTAPSDVEAELQSGQLNNGSQAITVMSVPPGTARQIAFGCDNGVKGQPPARIRVAIFCTGRWHVFNDQVVDGTKGLKNVSFPDPATTGVISVIRLDEGKQEVGYVVY
jgi:hypothetical protein